MRLVCGCLNLKIESKNYLDLEILDTEELAPEEKLHPYFSKNVYKWTGELSGISEVHSRLVKSEIVGSWNIFQCLICKMFVHATNYITGVATCSSSLKEEPIELKNYGRDKNMSYSQVFQVCFPSHLDVPEEFLSPLTKCDIIDVDCIEKISKQARVFLETAENKIASSTKSPMEEKQEQAMEALRRRIKCEESHLHMLILQSKNKSTTTVGGSVSGSTDRAYASNRPFEPYAHEGVDPARSEDSEGLDPASRLSALGSKFSADAIQEELDALRINPSARTEPESLESAPAPEEEGIFEMDDIGSPVKRTSYQSVQEQLTDEEEEGNASDFEEDVFAATSREIGPRDVAKSVPLNVPSWPNAIDRRDQGIDAKRAKDPQEIAASMRELARSVRTTSVDVFGDLPRSNFSSKKPDFLP